MMVSLISFAYAKGCRKRRTWCSTRGSCVTRTMIPCCGLGRDLTRKWAPIYAKTKDFAAYLSRITDLVDLVLPRFVHEGKKYATIAIGCTGGRHRSVYMIERLAAHMASRLTAMHAAGESGLDWRQTVTHRELTGRSKARGTDRSRSGRGGASQGSINRGTSSGALRAPETTGNDVRSDGDGQKTTSIQAQEA
jgi:UPF0042 nucleotide-binding protein